MTLRILALVVSTILWHGASARHTDEAIAGAIRTADWFALDSICRATPADSAAPFTRVFSQCLTSHRFYRTEKALPAFRELFANHGGGLGAEARANSAILFAANLSHEGLNEAANVVLSHVIESTRDSLPPSLAASMETLADHYRALSNYTPYDITIPEGEPGVIPFTIARFSSRTDGGEFLSIDKASVNSLPVIMELNTGLGTNIVTDSLAKTLGLIPLSSEVDSTATYDGARRFAMAKEVRIGNIAIADVPFLIIPSGLPGNHPDMMLGCELMLKLKDLAFDFVNDIITVSPETSGTPGSRPNLCLSADRTLLYAGHISGERSIMSIDTGNDRYASLSHSLAGRLGKDTLSGDEGDIMTDLDIEIGGSSATTPYATVETAAPGRTEYDCSVGLQTLVMLGRVRLNFTDMTLTAYTPRLSLSDYDRRRTIRMPGMHKNARVGGMADPYKPRPFAEDLCSAMIGGILTTLLSPGSNYLSNVADLLFPE